MPDAEPGAARLAGAVAGLAGLGTFLVLHHAWITPIWFIAPVGAAIAAGGGAVVGSAYAELLPGLPARPWRGPAVAVAFGLTLVPSVLIADLTGPLVELRPDGGATFLVPGWTALVAVAGGLVGPATTTGLAIGAVVGRSRRAASWMALAGAALAIAPGHNVPFLGGGDAAWKGVLLLLPVVGVASITMVEIHAATARAERSTLDPRRPRAAHRRG